MSTPSAGPRPFLLPVRQGWLDRRREDVLAPDLPIVDPHHHLWDRPVPGGRYLLDELLADRCMFESNFPVDKAAYSYAVFWNACKRLAQGASATEQRALFRDTAARVSRLALPADA